MRPVPSCSISQSFPNTPCTAHGNLNSPKKPPNLMRQFASPMGRGRPRFRAPTSSHSPTSTLTPDRSGIPFSLHVKAHNKSSYMNDHECTHVPYITPKPSSIQFSCHVYNQMHPNSQNHLHRSSPDTVPRRIPVIFAAFVWRCLRPASGTRARRFTMRRFTTSSNVRETKIPSAASGLACYTSHVDFLQRSGSPSL